MEFETRRAAGQLLAKKLHDYAGNDTVVVGLTRGGIVVGHEIARILRLPFDAMVVQKIAEPQETHVHVGSVAEPGHLAVSRRRLRALGLEPGWLEEAVARGVEEVGRRSAAYRGGRPRQQLAERRVILVDDAIGTGTTLRAAVKAVLAMGAREIIVAVPVAPASACAALQRRANRVVCLATPAELIAQGLHYPLGGEVSDDDISNLLGR